MASPGDVEKVQDHDFPGPEVPRAYPYGIYDLARNTGFVNVGTDHDTASFAVASIRGWWRHEGGGCIRAPRACSSPPMAGAATATASAFGNGSCNAWPTRPAWRSRSATSRRAPASGTKSNTACSRLSPPTGAENHYATTKTVVGLIACTTTAKGLEGQLPAGPPPLPAGQKDHARANGQCQFETGTFSWGVELFHLSR